MTIIFYVENSEGDIEHACETKVVAEDYLASGEYGRVFSAEGCPDCAAIGETRGHMGCEYPTDAGSNYSPGSGEYNDMMFGDNPDY